MAGGSLICRSHCKTMASQQVIIVGDTSKLRETLVRSILLNYLGN